MEKELLLRQFDEIEQKIETLISANRSLESQNREYLNKIEHLEGELQTKTEEETRNTEAKILIRNKIDKLISKLDEITETG